MKKREVRQIEIRNEANEEQTCITARFASISSLPLVKATHVSYLCEASSNHLVALAYFSLKSS